MSFVSPRSMIVQFCSMMSICMFIVIISYSCCVFILFVKLWLFCSTLIISIQCACGVDGSGWFL